ncbi:MAG: hypothetical protein AB7O66_05040 [Limisphaerales bacterium]
MRAETMIYDTFPLFNELELLEIRLHELDPVVDRFVIAEAPRTHSNQPKPLHFAENRERFQRFLPKITHIVADDLPDSSDAWVLEGAQRRAVDRGLTECQPDDIILHSDLDEIPSARAVRDLADAMRSRYRSSPLANAWHALLRQRAVIWAIRNAYKRRHPFVWLLEQRMHYYFLNCVSVNKPVWLGTRATFFRDYTSAFDLRRWGGRLVPDAGWHFSYMGGVERVRQKLAAFAHQEYNHPEFTDPQHIEAALESGRWILGDDHVLEFVPLDATFPTFIREDPGRFRDWIRTRPT